MDSDGKYMWLDFLTKRQSAALLHRVSGWVEALVERTVRRVLGR